MRKTDFMTGIFFVAAGIVFFAIGCIDTPLQSLFCGLAGAGLGPGAMMISKYVYWSHPDRKAKYAEKLETEKIELHDERKEMLRGKAARYLHAYTLAVVGMSVIIFHVLEKFKVFGNCRIFIVYLGMLFFSELFLSRWIFRQLEKKY